MPEPVKGQEKRSFVDVWEAVREGKRLTVSLSDDGRVLISARDANSRVAFLLDRNEAAGMAIALLRVLLGGGR